MHLAGRTKKKSFLVKLPSLKYACQIYLDVGRYRHSYFGGRRFPVNFSLRADLGHGGVRHVLSRASTAIEVAPTYQRVSAEQLSRLRFSSGGGGRGITSKLSYVQFVLLVFGGVSFVNTHNIYLTNFDAFTKEKSANFLRGGTPSPFIKSVGVATPEPPSRRRRPFRRGPATDHIR